MMSTRVELSVPEWSSLYLGHFEGAPVLSGVSQLFLLQRLLQCHLPEASLAGFERLRFKATAGPRDILAFELNEPNERGQMRVTIKRDSETIMEGVLRVR